jgi:acylphosphatase
MKFEIIGDKTVHNVGARPKIYELANKNGVKVFPRNSPGNKIEVIVEGNEENIRAFRDCVAETDLRELKNPTEPYEIGDLEGYEGDAPDFGYFAGSITMEQVAKGTQFLGSIDARLENLPQKLAEVLNNKRKEK